MVYSNFFSSKKQLWQMFFLGKAVDGNEDLAICFPEIFGLDEYG